MQISLSHFVELQDIAKTLADRTKPLDREALAARLSGVLDRTGPDQATRLNLNDLVQVKLSEHGRSIHAKNWQDLRTGHESVIRDVPQPEPDADGVSTWHLWELMHVFGPHVFHGSDIPFDDNMLVFDPNAELKPATEPEIEGAAPRM